MNRSLFFVFCTLLILAGLPSVLAQDGGWPRTLPLEQGTVTIYPLQVDEMTGDVIQFRAALAYRETAGSDPVFGAGWFESVVEIDSSNRLVHPTGFKVTETRFPAGTDNVQAELSAVLAQQSPAWNLDFSLDELEAGLKQVEAETMATEQLNTAPPRVVYRDHPALLVSMDGEPVLREIENSPYEAVINTPYPLIFDGKNYYLNVAKDVWYRSGKATGPYKFESRPPKDIAAMVNAGDAGAADETPAEPITAATAPEIVVSTEPAELVVTEGPAVFVPLVDDLLVLQNSDDDVFMHVGSQKFYIVLAGRWYRASALDGPWDYQPADQLPAAFAEIPKGSDQSDSRVYVAGTDEAKDAVLDAYVPQTAAVARGEAAIDVNYDGAPVYQPVDGTDLVYIENTGSTVLLADGLYYLVEDGVWYVSPSPDGPWQVATRRPAQVDTILPTSPVHNVKYVQIYDATPDVVYVGYTPGYTGSYVYHNTIVYGSGWYYQPWVSPYYYYPRHSTWGFNVSYNPWNGWNFGLSWGWGPFSVSYYTGGYWHNNHYWHHRHYGRWGPRGYRPRHYGRRGYGHGRYADRGHGRYADRGHGDRRRGGRGDRPRPNQRHENLYRDGGQRARVVDTRDRPPRDPGNRDQYAAVRNKHDRSRTTPVNRSELRVKADVRDANYRASRERLFADNSGDVYRKATRGKNPVRNQPVSRNSGPVRNEGPSRDRSPAVRTSKSTRSRTTPVKSDNRKAVSRKNVSRNNVGRAQARTGDRQPVPVPRQSQAPAPRQAQARAPAPRQAQAPAPRQNQAPAPRQNQAPAPRQNQAPASGNRGSRQDRGPQRSGKGGVSRTAPVKSASKRGKQKRN